MELQVKSDGANASLKAPKKSSAALGVAKFNPTHVYHIFGYDFLFAYNLGHIMTVSIMLGYINQHAFARYGLFATLQTGNLIFLAVSTDTHNNQGYPIYTNVTLLCCSVLVGGLCGPWPTCAFLEMFGDRIKAYTALSFCLLSACIASLCFDIYIDDDDFTGDAEDINSVYNYTVLLIIFCGSAIAHWTTKLGFLTGLNTGNMMKIGETLYKLVRNITQGGKKLRGDMVIVSSIVICFFVGAALSSVANAELTTTRSLIPLIIFIPFDLMMAWEFPSKILDHIFHLHHDDDHDINDRGKIEPSSHDTRSTYLVKQALGPANIRQEQAEHHLTTLIDAGISVETNDPLMTLSSTNPLQK